MSRDELAEVVVTWLAEHDDKGREMAFDGNHLGKIERGVVGRPRTYYIAALCAVLGATEDELGFALHPENPLAHEGAGWDRAGVAQSVHYIARDYLAANRRQAITAAVLVGASLTQPLQRWLEPYAPTGDGPRANAFTPPEIAALELLTAQFKSWSGTGNGALARRAVIAQLFELNERLRDAPSGPLTMRAMLVAAQLAETAAAMSWDAGSHREAQRNYVLAVKLAKLAGDNEFAAVTLADLGRQCYDLGRPRDGLEIVQLAQYGTRRSASTRLRAMLATREGWAHALRGEVHAFQRAAGLAQDHFTETSTEQCRWVRGFDAAELHGVIGARFRDLARHDAKQARHAQNHIELALRLRDPSKLRSRAFDLIGLARTCLITREPEHAATLIDEALPLARTWAAGRVGFKLADFHRESAPYTRLPEVREVRDAIRDTIRAERNA